ncbi:hypothetical protein J2S89_003216 [Arthrobacter bambusae]|nr:hypothetical protein [Arthrobacter bambusae]MDQ0099587.1 hypothetical protein [Arthrobacter bambusae]
MCEKRRHLRIGGHSSGGVTPTLSAYNPPKVRFLRNLYGRMFESPRRRLSLAAGRWPRMARSHSGSYTRAVFGRLRRMKKSPRTVEF